MELSLHQLRVIGCLIEKSLTTPDQYPLSLNALTNACNQKSNRDPVLSLTESEVQDTIDTLAAKGLIMNQSGVSSRVAKYKHRFCNTEFGELQLTAQELGIICVFFLRGPQTPGELRTRTNRLCEFNDVHETEQVLNKLMAGGKDAKVIRLEREPGKRESRYEHCFGDSQFNANQSEPQFNSHPSEESPSAITSDSNSNLVSKTDQRVAALEEQVELMQLEIDELREALEKN
ncbi:MAG: YceH family protein [Kangiellaceae bacterium]|nr:YceH family protein [Kangiellaceae bacterium]